MTRTTSRDGLPLEEDFRALTKDMRRYRKGSGMIAKLIAYECDASEHQPSLLHPDKLTIHEHEWAFCPFDAHANGHRWKRTGGIDLASLTRRLGLPSLQASESQTTG